MAEVWARIGATRRGLREPAYRIVQSLEVAEAGGEPQAEVTEAGGLRCAFNATGERQHVANN